VNMFALNYYYFIMRLGLHQTTAHSYSKRYTYTTCYAFVKFSFTIVYEDVIHYNPSNGRERDVRVLCASIYIYTHLDAVGAYLYDVVHVFGKRYCLFVLTLFHPCCITSHGRLDAARPCSLCEWDAKMLMATGKWLP